MISANEALTRLKEGNARFAADSAKPYQRAEEALPRDFANGQEPFAIILGCSDSRVPAEIVFDQTIGDLFVVRVAGNVLAPALLGSIEFAVEHFGSPLVVVLGHSKCGAVQATVESIENNKAVASKNVEAVVEQITPVVHAERDQDPTASSETIRDRAIRSNVHASTKGLLEESPALKELANAGKLMVVGAEYNLENGLVEFLD